MTNDSTPRPESTTRWVREPSPGQFREGEWRVYVGSDDDWFRLVETGLVPTFVGEAPLPEGESKEGWTITPEMIDAGAKHLRESAGAGKQMTPWNVTLKSTKKKWLALSESTLRAALCRAQGDRT